MPSTAFTEMSADDAVRIAFNVVLRREPDPSGAEHFRRQLDDGVITRSTLVEQLLSSSEFRLRVPFTDLLVSMHMSRCQFVRGLPRASRILDLGGTDLGDESGALVSLGYPYSFDQLTVIDLPPDDRHELYRSGSWRRSDSRLGPVVYQYHSMTDLSRYEDGAFDLVYSGQSIEHVTEDEGRSVIDQVHRIVSPGGWFCLDTPNGPVWRVQGPDLINPDHKIEYADSVLRSRLQDAGFDIVEAKGLNYMGEALSHGRFDAAEAAANVGVFADIEHCLHLAYVCRKAS